MTFDILIRNAMIVDGTGKPGYRGDVAIQGDRLVEVGAVHGRGLFELDVQGSVVSPGFIDVHTHDDRLVLIDRSVEPKVSQGVTTVVVGNCGVSLAPLVLSVDDPVPPLNIIGSRDDFRFGTYRSYLNEIKSSPPAVNVAPLVGHMTLRVAEMTMLNRQASPSEIAGMRCRLAEALEAGALGLSSGVFYPPSSAATREEILPLLEEVCRRGRLYSAHIRDEGDRIFEALDEALDCARSADVPIIISHLKCASPKVWGESDRVLRYLDKMSDRQTISFDVYPYMASSTMIRKEMVEDARRVTISWSKPHPEAAGRDLAEIARQWDCSLEVAADKLSPGGAVYFRMDEEDVRRILRHPRSMIGSDGLPHDIHPHPRLWGSFPRVLGHYVREVNLFQLEEAVRKMTSLPAEALGLKDRGVIAPDKCADLVVFDPKEIDERATFDEPMQGSSGVSHVFVNGELVWEAGKSSGRTPGRVLSRASGAGQ
ncbi:D-aminoacylase [Pelagibius litoralis]|uniref:D-aminoacylase n=1 Tax=Pelagibius litoralis TaxID=374515 RepID=A0A967F0Y8_9PROT|nr:D-aminoacylase [Pelagibius litoralis]NIA70971.1 D-aminoacylase [Pelagibius litoralis]